MVLWLSYPGAISPAAFASSEWRGWSARDLVMLIAGLVFCVVVVRIMTWDSPAMPQTDEESVVEGAAAASDNASTKERDDE